MLYDAGKIISIGEAGAITATISFSGMNFVMNCEFTASDPWKKEFFMQSIITSSFAYVCPFLS